MTNYGIERPKLKRRPAELTPDERGGLLMTEAYRHKEFWSRMVLMGRMTPDEAQEAALRNNAK